MGAGDGEFPFPLTVARAEAPNLLRNPGFEHGNPKPDGWSFGGSAGFGTSAGLTNNARSGAVAAWVRGKSDWPAYWTQSLPVREGVCYYAALYTKFHLSSGHAGLRVYTNQYADPGSWTNRTSHTDVRAYYEEGQGQGLEDFLDPRYLNQVKPDQWNLHELEFVVPAGKKITHYILWAGQYGIGETLLDDAYLGEAAFALTGTMTGSGLKTLRVVDAKGQQHLNLPLKADATAHTFQVTLPSRLSRYFLDVTDSHGKSWRKSL
jgi:hypothetical protein